jgi:hypothetical protein
LARHVIIMLGSKTFSLDRGWHYLSTYDKTMAESPMSDFFELNTTRASIFGSPLICLLLKFYIRKCSVARDRIFSLVSLCSEKNDIKIDYECPVFRLAHQIVAACRNTICMCTTVLILDMLEPDIHQLSSDELALLVTDGPYLEFELADRVVTLDPNIYVHQGGSCALLVQLIRDSDPVCPVEHKGENQNFPKGYSWSKRANDYRKWKFRVSFVYAWIWYKQQERPRWINIEQRLSIRSKLVGKYSEPTDHVPHLGWGNAESQSMLIHKKDVDGSANPESSTVRAMNVIK